MNFLRKLLRGLLLLVVMFCVSSWLSLAILQATVLNRTVVKGWLQTSGVYEKGVSNAVLVESSSGDSKNTVMPQLVVTEALDRTFPPAYVQQHVEKVLDSSYDWFEGKTDAIRFEIPIQEKRQEFATHLAALLEPRFAKLPLCPDAVGQTEDITCITKGMTPESMAKYVAEQATSGSSFLQLPITEKIFAQTQNTGNNIQANAFLGYIQLLRALLWFLPLIALAACAAYVFLHDDKLRGLAYIGRRICVGGLVTLGLAVVAYYVGSSVSLAQFLNMPDPRQAVLFTNLVEPILKVALPSLAYWMAVYSGGLVTISLPVWVTARILIRRKLKVVREAPLKQVDVIKTMPGPVPPSVPQEDGLKPPIKPGDIPSPKV